MSMITSHKTMTPQQNFRVKFAKQNKSKFDLYGVGFNHIKNKNSGLDDYMFSVAIENATYDTYFTEKITDCFAAKTIPIYKGTKKINKFFNEKGIIFLEDINNDISTITAELYEDKLEYVEDNFNRVKEFDILDDWIYNKYIKN